MPPVGSAEALADHDTDRYGFTHQEMLDNVGIIHMNGRIYDPNLGRFLSVDPVFEFPTNTQSLNPYSYVLNNPLSMTDPTGYVVNACNAGQTTCSISVSVSITKETTAHDIDSHIAVHGQTTITTTREANGNTVQTASGNGFGLGETAEVSAASMASGIPWPRILLLPYFAMMPTIKPAMAGIISTQTPSVLTVMFGSAVEYR
ncbi:MAG: RHS repeat-associated core domain-containing protein [Gammaproteobacteria bacterium]|nr:RHS repeat-associated core domain-containing protein [Gammaproteobacteria bacterium]